VFSQKVMFLIFANVFCFCNDAVSDLSIQKVTIVNVNHLAQMGSATGAFQAD
jgi:hypothetical protein